MAQVFSDDTFQSLKRFLLQPIREISQLPNWTLSRTLAVQALTSALSGVIAGLLPLSLWRFLNGLIFFPFLVTVMTAVLASFFYYVFQILDRRTVPYTRLLNLVFFANLPYLIFHVSSSLFPFADLIGLSMSALLLTVGLSENFNLEKKRAMKWVGFIFVLLFILWGTEKITTWQGSRMPDAVDHP